MQQRTLYKMFLETVGQHGSQPATRFKPDRKSDYTTYTYSELHNKVQSFRRGLDKLGLQRGDRLALLAHENRVEWMIADLAAHSLGIITVAIYGTLPATQVSYYLQDSGAKAILLSDAKQLAKILPHREQTPALQYLIAMEGGKDKLEPQGVLAFDEVLTLGDTEGRSIETLDAEVANVSPSDTATLIYTSGTTGDPKGAMLSHTALLHAADAVVDEPIVAIGPGDVFLSFLPLSHITERVGGYILPVRTGACITYSEGLASFFKELTETVRPTILLCVPRLWETIYDRFKEGLPKMPANKQKVINWAVGVGEKVAQRKSIGSGVDPFLAIQHFVAEKLAFAQIREKVSGGRLRYCVSGGAPLDPVAATFFLAVGIQILEGYGLSEAGIICVNRPGKQRIGTVGNILPRMKMKLAEDGEILANGDARMNGYWNKPEATAEAIDSEGWFHTGDIGEISPDGYLKITDRKKDIIVLTNGKKVAPQPIEALLKHSPFIGEAVLLGDKQSTISALLVPVFDKLKVWAKTQSLPSDDLDTLLAHPEVQKLYKGEIERATPNLADYEKIKRFRLLDKPFSVETGEITPTLKVKRKFVLQKYDAVVATMRSNA